MFWKPMMRLGRDIGTAIFLIVAPLFQSTGHSQFGQSGFFNDMLNQALPRVNQPYGQPVGSSTYNGLSNGYNSAQPANTAYPTSSLTSTGFNSGLVPNAIGRSRDWKLGVGVDNLDTGSIVRSVSPGSAAQRAGIEQNDLIVAISGYQVGIIEGRLNDVGDQIRRTADINGRVRALVRDARTGQLQNIDIQLDSASTGVSGMVITRDQSNLGYGSILTVKINNVSRPFYEVQGGQTISQIYGQGPYPFELHYDPRYIDPRDQYELTATITSPNGQLLYSLPQPISMNQQSLPPNVSLTLEGVGSVIQASYPGDPNQLNQVFQQLLGRYPSAKEQVAWSSYLSQGNSIADLRAKILGSPNYYDRLGNDPQRYVQSVYEAILARNISQAELVAWTNRLQQLQGQRELLVRELIQQSN